MLNANGQANHVFADAGFFQLLRRELAMRGAGGVGGQCFGIADIDQTQNHLQRILEARAACAAALDAKIQNARGVAAHVFLHQWVVGMAGQAAVIDPMNFWVLLQKLCNLAGVFANAIHAQRQGLQPLQNQESIHGADGSPHITQGHGARPANVGGGAQRLGIDHAVVADFRGVQAFETLFVLCPGEFATVHNDTAQAGAVAANVFGQRVHHNVCAMLKRAAQIGAGHGVVHNQRNARSVCNLSQFFEIGHVA